MYDGPRRPPVSGLIPSDKGKIPVEDLKARLSRLCSDIAQIEHELKQVAQQQDGQPVELCDEQLLAEVKSAVDRVRHLLWPYVEAAANRANGIDQALQHYRMERVTAMLQELSERLTEPRLEALPEAQSFFSNIQEIATNAVEKHLERSTRTPAARSPLSKDSKTFVN